MKKLLLVFLALSMVVVAGCSGPARVGTASKSPTPSVASQGGTDVGLSKDANVTDVTKKAKELAQQVMSGGSAVIKGDPMIAVVMPTLDSDGWVAYYTAAIMGALKTGAGIITYSANNDAQKEVNIIDDLVVKKVQGILFSPVDSAALSVAVQKANAANIPIVAMDRTTDGGKVTAVFESNNVECGKQAAIEMAKVANGKQLKLFNLQGDLSTSAGVERNKGFVNELKKYPNIKIVSQIAAGWDSGKGNAATLDAFQAHPDINAIYLPSDAYTPGVMAALSQIGRLKPVGDPGHIIIVSVDGQPIGLANLKKGYIDVSVSQQIFAVGEKAFEAVVKAVKGETITNAVNEFAPKVITKANVNNSSNWGVQFAQ